MVSIGAIKYSILRQAIGGDIIFDFEKSISFEGDSDRIFNMLIPVLPILRKLRQKKVKPLLKVMTSDVS